MLTREEWRIAAAGNPRVVGPDGWMVYGYLGEV